MNLHILSEKAGKLVTDNASSILTAGGVVGVGLTAILTARGTFKAAELMREEMAKRQVILDMENQGSDKHEFAPDFTLAEKVKLVWPHYIPPVAIGVATMGSIVMANQMSAKRAAALAAAYGISEQRLQEYKDKVTEKLGTNKERAVRDEIAQDRVNNNPPTNEVIIIAGGDVLCYDMLTGRYFQSSVENIKRAENKINQDMFHHQYASLSSFYQEVDLPPTNYTDEVGWNLAQDGPLEVRFSTTMSPDDRPCIAVDFSVPPNPNYTQLY